jgi:nucleoside-diphosphate-sugar epimerase
MNNNRTVLITGATGFIGKILSDRLLENDVEVNGTILASETVASLSKGVRPVTISPLGPDTDWTNVLQGIDTIIHLAARVHVMDDTSLDPLAEFRRVNVVGTERLARDAARVGVKRMVFISSVKVNGEETEASYSTYSVPAPTDPYGISKWEAEQCVRQIEAETGLEVVIVRPTLVYGPGVKANFLKMLATIKKGIPLPLASINNRRSLIYVGNLVDALALCASHPDAAGKTYLVSDGEDVSTPELIRRTASALDVQARLLPFPPTLMRLMGGITGKSSAVNRLLGSLTVDSSAIRRELGWKPPFTMEQGLAATADWFLGKR